MKTRELIEKLKECEKEFGKLFFPSVYQGRNDFLKEIIKRLEELEELKRIIKNPHITQDETMAELIEKTRKMLR